jgi:ABC-2 type transport system permease protein
MQMNQMACLFSKFAHISRIWVIAWHAFTQLVRMKVFYFLAFFAVILIASNFFNLPQHAAPESMGVNVLYMIKSWSLGAMTLFSVVMAIVATALLIPKDIEDRTLYTILAKPVPRFDYLAGKLLGVLILLGVSLLVMDILMTGILHLRTNMVVLEQVELAKGRGWAEADVEILRQDIHAQGSTWSLQGAVLAVFLRAAIMASMALLISTFSSSTLFTTVISFLIFFIGHFQADARAAYLSEDGGMSDNLIARGVSLVISLILPDLQLFNVIDGVIEGQVMPLVIMGKLVMVAFFYGFFHLLASWFIFAEKEF